MLLIRDCQPVIFEHGIFSFTQVWQSCVSWAVSGVAVPAGSSRRTAAGKPHSRCCCPAEARGSWSSSWCRAWTDGTSPSGPPTPPAGSWRQPQESQVRTTSGGAASSAEPWNEHLYQIWYKVLRAILFKYYKEHYELWTYIKHDVCHCWHVWAAQQLSNNFLFHQSVSQ